MKRTHPIVVKLCSVFLAAAVQLLPLVRSLLPAMSEGMAPSGWAIVFRWAAGGVAMFGYHAVSSASTIAISPANATVGQPYVGTITYSGGHAGSVSSMSLSNVCLGSLTPLFDGLSIVYSGGNTASVTGTPIATNTYSFTLKMFDSSGCGGGNSDTRSTSLVVGPAASTGVAPVITSPPQGVTAQIGADALLSAGASGTPSPGYYWYRGLPNIATNLVAIGSSVDFPAVQLTNAGLYTVVASNASGQASAPAFLSVVVTPGSNQLALNYTNYAAQGQPLTMYSYITNVASGSNLYKWQYNSVDVTPYSATGNELNLTAAQATGSKSGKYSVVFNSVVGASTIVPDQAYYSYWAFGLPPLINDSPQGVNATAGATVVFSAAATNLAVPPLSSTLPYYGTNTPLTFQWFLNGSNVVATQMTNGLSATENLVLNSVGASDAGNYTVVVSNYWGSVTSSPAALTLNASSTPPSIILEPSPASVLAGQNATFSVTAAGSPPLTYQWQFYGSNLVSGGAYSGAHTNALTIAGAELGNAGAYSVVISNSTGFTNSVTAPLSVSLPPSLGVDAGPSGLRLSASTVPGLAYVLLTATNLAYPWTVLETNTVPADGLLSVTNSTGNPQEYYRLIFP
jgi:hypothetical protein